MSTLRTFAKWGAISLTFTVLTWSAALLWWQATQRLVTTSDIVIYLIVIPAAPLACVALHNWYRSRKKPVTEHPSIQTAVPEASATSSRSKEGELALPILNTWAVTAAGSSAEEFLQTLSERRNRPQPDPALTDDEGFPVLSGRVADLDTEHAEQRLSQAIAAGELDYPAGMEEWRSAFHRSLALLELLAAQIAPDCHMLADTIERQSEAHEENAATLRGALNVPAERASTLQLHIALVVPASFLPQERQFALEYFIELLPFSRTPNLHFELVPATDDTSTIALLNRFGHDTQRRNDQHALLLAACDSMLCSAVLEEWLTNDLLFKPRCPNALMAGEAAFGILCANDAALHALSAEAKCRMAGASIRKRELSADMPGKPSHFTLSDAVLDVLALSGISSEQIGTIASDTDHRTSRVLECIGTMMSHTPHLDAIENRLAVNAACGHLGAASWLGILTAGTLQAMTGAHPVLLMNVSHPTERAAALLLPALDS